MKRMKRPHNDLSDYNEYQSHERIICNQYPCVLNSVPLELYHLHIEQYHEYICEDCNINLTSKYLLDIHLEEIHNPFRKSLIFLCFESNCLETFLSHYDRIMHLKKVHYYPASFNFDLVYKGISI